MRRNIESSNTKDQGKGEVFCNEEEIDRAKIIGTIEFGNQELACYLTTVKGGEDI